MSEATFRFPAHWYDGRTAVRREGTAVWDGAGGLRLEEPGEPPVTVDIAKLRYQETRRHEIVYSAADEADFRLVMPADMPPGLAAKMPAKAEYGRWIDRIGLGRAAAGFAVVSAAAVALFLTLPEWLGPMVPQAWERRMGDAMVGDLGNRLCHTPAGDAALAKLLNEVDPAREKVRAGVANIEMVNAVALPGGQVLLFDGLVQEAESPEELAGILAHEVGHVRERHVMTAMLRQFGLSILSSGIGSNVGGGIITAASLSYSRDAEQEADVYARTQMARSDINPAGAAQFFERKLEEAGGESENVVTGWIATHPASGNRAKAFRESAIDGKTYAPVLTDAEFAALKSMCEDDNDVEEFDLF